MCVQHIIQKNKIITKVPNRLTTKKFAFDERVYGTVIDQSKLAWPAGKGVNGIVV